MRRKCNEMTGTERALLEFVASRVDEFGYQPSYREVAAAWGYSSTGYILALVNSLKRKGFVTSTGPRAIGFDYKSYLSQ